MMSGICYEMFVTFLSRQEVRFRSDAVFRYGRYNSQFFINKNECTVLYYLCYYELLAHRRKYLFINI